MQGREFLETAKTLIPFDTEDCLRTASGRIYYALFLETRDALTRWGFLPPQYQAHAFVRTRFQYAGVFDLKAIGKALEDLWQLRSEADYELWHSIAFYDDSAAQFALRVAEVELASLDAVDADPVRRAAAVAAIRAVP